MEFLSDIYDAYQFDRTLPATQELRRFAMCQFIPGSGSRLPRAIFVGYRPDANEHTNRRPISGVHGDMFERMLNDAGMLRSDVFITYLIKFFAPRPTSAQEKDEALPLLRREIALMGRGGCRTIVLMGGQAAESLGMPLDEPGQRANVDGWNTFLIDDPRQVFRSRSTKAIRAMQVHLNTIGQHVNNLVE